jgi:(p)ppGpp synthase/HD superfamily hydrolase
MPRIKKRHEPSLLERALVLALEAHWGHQDAFGQPYILHPLAVMHGLEDEDERVVAVLHDTVENGGDRISFDRLRAEGYSEHLIQAIDCMTDREGEPYEMRIERIAADPLARRVYLAHLRAAMDERSNFEITAEEEKRRRSWAIQRLLS